MSRLVDQYGVPFTPSPRKDMLSPRAIAKAAQEILKRADDVEEVWRLWELRHSCGAPGAELNATVSVRKPARYGTGFGPELHISEDL